MPDRHYEELYNRLLDRGISMHMNNKKRIRIGLILLALLPVILMTIRWLTDSDKVVFLIIWVAFMFAICIYLIGVEYIDDSLQKSLEDITDREAEFGELIMSTGDMHDRMHERIQKRSESIHERLKARHEEIHERYARRLGGGDTEAETETASETGAKAGTGTEKIPEADRIDNKESGDA